MTNWFTDTAAADMISFNVGFKAGHDDGKNAVFDLGDTCGNYNFTRCSDGYTDGYNTTCHIVRLLEIVPLYYEANPS